MLEEDEEGVTPGPRSRPGRLQPRAPEGGGGGLATPAPEARPFNPELPGNAPAAIGWGRGGVGGAEGGKAGALSPSPRRLWVPRNFRTLPESFQSSAWVR